MEVDGTSERRTVTRTKFDDIEVEESSFVENDGKPSLSGVD